METTEPMIKDTRTPESVTRVTHKGRVYIVSVFDEAAYRANIARYYPKTESARTPAPDRKATRSYSYARQKAASRYNWTGGYKALLGQKGA